MIRLLRFLIFGDIHSHKWKFKERLKQVEYSTNVIKAYIYIYECEHCGNLKETRISCY